MKIYNNNSSLTPVRDSLALSRTVMANERTLLAYIRTGMTFVIAGVGVLQFIQDGIYIFIGGWILVVVGVYFFCWGTIRYRRSKTSFDKTL